MFNGHFIYVKCYIGNLSIKKAVPHLFFCIAVHKLAAILHFILCTDCASKQISYALWQISVKARLHFDACMVNCTTSTCSNTGQHPTQLNQGSKVTKRAFCLRAAYLYHDLSICSSLLTTPHQLSMCVNMLTSPQNECVIISF